MLEDCKCLFKIKKLVRKDRKNNVAEQWLNIVLSKFIEEKFT